jgi:hypothetical protein
MKNPGRVAARRGSKFIRCRPSFAKVGGCEGPIVIAYRGGPVNSLFKEMHGRPKPRFWAAPELNAMIFNGKIGSTTFDAHG